MSRTSDKTYRRARRRLKRSADADQCHWCHRFIDLDLPWPHRDSWTADHLIQIKDGGHNHGELVPSHWHCNLARRYAKPPVRHARNW